MKARFARAILLGILMLGASVAQAYLPAVVVPRVTPQSVVLEVENAWAAPIVCRGQFFAQTYSAPAGIWLDFAIGPVVAGTRGFAEMVPPYVYQGDYFISVPRIEAVCDFI